MYKVLVPFCFLLLGCLAQEKLAPVVKILPGKVQGLVKELDNPKGQIYLYQGIRFATAKRFEKPVAVKSFDEDVYDATKVRDSCIELGSFKTSGLNHSEDCLFLNVYKPATEAQNDGKLLPVMFWIYGGGFQVGSIFSPMYDGSYLASMGQVIVVSVNYRLGPFGFLYAGTEDAPGNQGLYDQLMGLEWVRDNIQAFGGDPEQVTIFGVSAGSISTSAMILSPLAKGLFKRAILESGGISPSFVNPDVTESLRRTKMFASNMNCSTENKSKMLECLRAKPVKDIEKEFENVDLFANETFFPMEGNEFYPEDSAKFLNPINEVDLIYGLTHDEGSLFSVMILPELMNDTYRFTRKGVEDRLDFVIDAFKLTRKQEIHDYYLKNFNGTDLNQVRKMFDQFFGDFIMICSTTLFAERVFKVSKQEHHYYAYRFDRRQPAAELFQCAKWMGVCHGGEIPYVMRMPYLFPKSPEDLKLSAQMIGAWTQFAKTGQPGLIGTVKWEEAFPKNNRIEPEEPVIASNFMSLNLKSQMIKNPFGDSCHNLWDRVLKMN